MARITRLVLDVLKPHDPPVNLFAQHLADQAPRLQVTVEVVEIDEKTQTLSVTIEGDDIDLPEISDLIATMGGSLHSVDKVCALSDAGED
jgi:hypothetical protein